VVTSLIYVSTAAQKLSNELLSSLAEQSNARNVPLDVTGLLLYSDGNFMQCLEGPKEAIDILMKSIASDARHFGLIVLKEDEIQIREFPEWGMAVRSPGEDLETIARSQAIDVWLNTSIDEQKSFTRILLGNFWQGVTRHRFNQGSN
jgi:hypothetical protein